MGSNSSYHASCTRLAWLLGERMILLLTLVGSSLFVSTVLVLGSIGVISLSFLALALFGEEHDTAS